MLEIHFYFTPILDKLEQTAFDDENDWYLHPVVNLTTAKILRDRAHLPKTVQALNACYDRINKIALDYLTINLHGRKYGRKFLIELQNELADGKILEYSNVARHRILARLGLSTADFKIFRNFSKHALTEDRQDFQRHKFSQTPASIVLTDTEELHVKACTQASLCDFIGQIEQTA